MRLGNHKFGDIFMCRDDDGKQVYGILCHIWDYGECTYNSGNPFSLYVPTSSSFLVSNDSSKEDMIVEHVGHVDLPKHLTASGVSDIRDELDKGLLKEVVERWLKKQENEEKKPLNVIEPLL